MSTPAEIAAEAAAIAERWEAMKSGDFSVPFNTMGAVAALLDDRERLRGLVAAAHIVQLDAFLGNDCEGNPTWAIKCMAPECEFETTFTGDAIAVVESIHNVGDAHIADVLEGRAS